MTEPEHEDELQEPTVTDVPEPDQGEEGEAEQAETENPDVPDPNAPVEPDEVRGEAEMEAAFKKIERSYKTYTRAVSNALEESANDLLPCPLCEGAVPSFVNRHDAGQVDQETQGAVYAFLSMTPPTELRKSRLNEKCENCDGLGELLTGSRVPAWETKTCDECNGAGFTGPGNPKFSAPVERVEPNGTETSGEGLNLSLALAAIKGGEGQ